MPAKQPHPTFPHLALIVIGLTLIVALIYIQTGGHQFLNYDDDIYITSNQHIQTGINHTSTRWAFTTTYASNYHPLTWLSHMLDYSLFGLNPKGHHLVNVFIHLANTLLLFSLLHILSGALWRSAMVGALFACHPLHVESVAWIAERKDLLSTLFWILTLMSYHYYLRNRTWKRYIQIILCFILGLLAKPMLVTLPCTLLLLDHWPYNRWNFDKESTWQLIREKIPLFAVSLLSILTTYYAQQKGDSVVSLTHFQFIDRVSNAAISYVSYLNKTIWPVKLAIFYPYPDSIQVPSAIGAVILLLLVTYLCLQRIKKSPYLAVGWFWYLGTLVPVIGLVQVGEQAMADRYTYIPLLGIFIIVAWGTKDIFAHFKGWKNRKRCLALLAAVVLVVCSVLSFQQTRYWRSTIEVFSHAAEVTENNYLAHFQLGTAYARTGEFVLADKHLRKAISQKPSTALAYNNLAYVMEREGNMVGAITNYQKSATLDPNNKDAHYNLGLIYLRRWQLQKAIHHLQRVLQISPDASMAQKNLLKAKKLLANKEGRSKN